MAANHAIQEVIEISHILSDSMSGTHFYDYPDFQKKLGMRKHLLHSVSLYISNESSYF